jgi:hypothetical protein
MERAVAATHFWRLLDVVVGQGFGFLKAGVIGLRISVFQHVLDTDVLLPLGVESAGGAKDQLRSRIFGVTVGLSRKYSAARVVKLLFADFKGRNPDFRELAITCFAKICADGTDERSYHRLDRVMDNLLDALDGSHDKKGRFIVRTIRDFAQKIGDRVTLFVQQVPEQIADQLRDSRAFIWRHAADLLHIFMIPLISCRCQDRRIYLYGRIQVFIGEEYRFRAQLWRFSSYFSRASPSWI